jgi:nucleoid-associated protein YgaU
MKKPVKIAALVGALSLCFVLAAACTSQPKSVEDALRNVYDRYYSDLILEGATTYTVVSGDMLSAISRNQYDNGFYYPVIMLASKDVVVDPDKIEPGMELIVPDLQKNLDSPRARANIKRFLGEVAKIEEDRNRPNDAQGMRNLADTL